MGKNKKKSPIEVRTVRKHGKTMRGVFATKDIPKGTFLCCYEGDHLSETEYLRKALRVSKNTKKSFKESIECLQEYDMLDEEEDKIITPLSDDGFLMIKKYGMAPVINEPFLGQRPNVVWVSPDEDVPSVSTITKRNIKRGEEILVYYGSEYERPYPCNKGLRKIKTPKKVVNAFH